MKVLPLVALSFLPTAILLTACSKKSSTVVAGSSISSVAVNFPTSLALSSPTTAAAGTSSALTEYKPVVMSADETAPADKTQDDDMDTKQKAAKALLAGTAADGCAPLPARLQMPSLVCSGSGFTVEDGSTTNAAFPLITVPTNLDIRVQGKRGLQPGDAGPQSSTETIKIPGQTDQVKPCMAAATEYYVARVSEYVTKATTLTGGMACAMKQASIDFPAVGTESDITTTIQTSWVAAKFITIKSAKIKTVEDGVYRYSLTGTLTRKDGVATSFSTFLTSKVDATDVTKKSGVLISFEKAVGLNEAAGKGAVAGSVGVSVAYSLVDGGASFYNAQRVSADDTEKLGSYLKTDGSLDFKTMTTKSTTTNAFPLVGGLTRIIASMNSDGTGTLVHAWQAQPDDTATRVFAVKVAKNADGSLSGAGIFGFSNGFNTEATDGPAGAKIKGMACGFSQSVTTAGVKQSIGSTVTPAVQQQKFSKSATATSWTLDETKASFAIATDCGAGTAADTLVSLNTDKTGTDSVAAPTVSAISVTTSDLGTGVAAP